MKRVPLDVISGVLLTAVGVLLFFRALGFAPDILLTSALVLVATLAAIFAVTGLLERKRGREFWGAFGCVAGAHLALWSSGVMVPTGEEIFAAGLLWFGLAFAFLWLSTPHKIDLLVPALLFGGPGVGYYLWWFEVARLRDMEHVIENGWPVLLVLLGGGILLRSLIPSRQ